ncbi:MAG: helix-turn-helix transcriptional regulator [Verrucomicrobiota bacterium]
MNERIAKNGKLHIRILAYFEPSYIVAFEAISMKLSHHDLNACSRVLRELYAETSLARFPDKLLTLLAGVVPVEHLTYNEFNERRNRYTVLIKPEVEEMQRRVPQLIAYLHQHPLYEHYLAEGSEPKKLSDAITVRQLKGTDIFQEVYKPLSTKHQMLFFVQGEGEARIGLALNRWHRDFSERDREVLMFLSPHITQAYKNAQVATDLALSLNGIGEGLGSIHRAVILAGSDGQIRWKSPLAHVWLEEFFPEHRSAARRLPVQLQKWIERNAQFAKVERPSFSELQLPSHGESRLLIYCGKTNSGEFLLALVRERVCISVEVARSFGLTPREAEILFWISEAKTNPEIAAILRVSLRTIHKHAEHLFAKIRVENRLSAQRLGLELRRI